MVKHRCGICNKEFSTASGLTQHANAKHNGRTSLLRGLIHDHKDKNKDQSMYRQDQNTMKTYGIDQL